MTLRPVLPTALLALLALPAGCVTDYDIKGIPGPEEEGDGSEASGEGEGEGEGEDGSTEDRAEGDDSLPIDDLGGDERPEGDTGAPEEEEPAEEESDPAPEDDCDHTSDLIYVIARDDSALYTFDPSALTMTRLGVLRCGTSGSPASMSVARDGLGYVRTSDDRLYAVDLETLDCEETAYSDRATGFGSFGMGYATDDADTWRDQLYVANETRLGRVDTETWELVTLGRMASQSELTGNAAGELWAFLPLESPAELARLDKEDASTLETIRLPGFPDAGDIDTFAFATWGGEFWLFVREYGMGSSTDVYRVTADGEMSRALDDVGFDVVGAGVSTCAPAE